MRKQDTPSLPGWIEDVYLSIEGYLQSQSDEESVSRQQAAELISEVDPDFNSADIDHALDHLLNRGWLYKVGDQLFITDFHYSESGDVDS